MAKRYFNWTLVVVLVVGSGVFAVAVFALHRWQVSTRAEQALPEGIQAYEQKDWDAAASRLGRYLGTHGDDVPVLLKYAEAQIKRRPATPGHFDQAINTYRSVLRFDPNNAQAAGGLVNLYLARKQLVDAEGVASLFLQRNDDPTLTRMLASAMRDQGKVTEAQTTLERLVKNHPEDALAYGMLGSLAEAQGADPNRLPASWYDEGVTANPQLAAAYLVRATFFLRKGDRDKAMADLAQAEKCDLSDYDVRLGLATTLTGMNDLERARGHFKALQAQDPARTELWRTWMILARRSGSLEEMATVAEAGVKALGADRWDFMPAATETFIYAGRTDQASDCIAQMRAKEVFPATVAYLEGLLADKQGRLRDAVEAWKRSLSLEPSATSPELSGKKNPGTRIQIAAGLERLGDLPSAISQLRTLTSEWPDYVDGHVRLAKYLIQTGDPASALKEVERFARDNPEASVVEVQARILLASEGSGSTADREREWQDIDARLQKLDKDTGGNPQVRLLQAQAAMRRGKPAEAAQLLEAVGKERPSDVQVSLLQAEMLVKQEKPDEAIALLRTAVEQSPQDIRPVRQLAILLDQQKDQAQCESVIKQAIARLERPEARRDLGLLLGGLYRSWAREDTAQQWLTDLAQQFPNDIQVTRGLLACAAVVRNTAQAQTLVDEIKSIERDGWQWRYEQVRVWINANSDKDAYSQSTYFKKNYYSQAVALLQENLRANPGDEDTRLMLARVHELAGQQQLALSAYREALTRSPDNLEVIQRTVLALLNAGDLDEAQKIIAEAGERKLYPPVVEKLKLDSQKLQWRDQLQRGAVDSAAETLKKLLERDPNDLSASLALALISMQQGRLDEAAVLLKQLRAKAPEAVDVIEAQAQLYLRQGNSQEALRLCDNMIQTARNPIIGYRIRARIYEDLREQDKAISDFSQVIAKDPNNAGAYVERAAYYQRIGQRNEALGDLRKALNLASIASPALKAVLSACLDSKSRALVHDAEAVLDKARIADANDLSLKVLKASFLLAIPTRSSIEQSQRLLREVTDAEPRFAEAWRMLSSLELRQGQSARALDTALRGLSFNEHNKPLLLLRADAAAAAYPPALVVPTLRGLTQTYPGDWELERRLAYALYKSGGKSEARSILNARMQADPNSPVPVLALIELLASDNDLDGVTQQVTNWRARHPDDVDFVVTVASVLVSGRADAETMRMAESLARATLDRDPNSVAALRISAVLTQKLGRVDESSSFARKALEREPNDLLVLNNLAWALCEDKGQYQEALALADRGLRVAPEYIDLIDTRGVIHYRLDHLEEAAQDFRACIDLYIADAPQIVAARFHLGRVYAKMGRKSEAQEQLRQALNQQQTLEQQNRAGSLSPADMAETKSLLEQLQKGE